MFCRLFSAATNWWLRSSISDLGDNFRNVNDNGDINNDKPSNMNGVSFGSFQARQSKSYFKERNQCLRREGEHDLHFVKICIMINLGGRFLHGSDFLTMSLFHAH